MVRVAVEMDLTMNAMGEEIDGCETMIWIPHAVCLLTPCTLGGGLYISDLSVSPRSLPLNSRRSTLSRSSQSDWLKGGQCTFLVQNPRVALSPEARPRAADGNELSRSVQAVGMNDGLALPGLSMEQS